MLFRSFGKILKSIKTFRDAIAANALSITTINNNLSPTVLNTVTKVSSTLVVLNGTNGANYGYVRLAGKLVLARFNLYCSASTGTATQIVGSGFPPSAFGDSSIIGLVSLDGSGSMLAGYINTSGQLIVMGGINGKYYYGTFMYIST